MIFKCTIWVGQFKLHANKARFKRATLNKGQGAHHKKVPNSPCPNSGDSGSSNSYVNAVKNHKSVDHDSPAIVLDEDCALSKDLSSSLMGRIKEFASLTNLKNALMNEGFVDLNVSYLGELWVLLEFSSVKSKEAFRDNVGVSSWFSEIRQASFDINPDGRIVWVEIEGVPLKLWTLNTFKRIVTRKVYWIRVKEVPLVGHPDLGIRSSVMNFEERKLNARRWMILTIPTSRKNVDESQVSVVLRISGTSSGAHLVSYGGSGESWPRQTMGYNMDGFYAPHDPRDKRMIWDYLAHVINQWQGEVVIMGDFNEVRVKSDRAEKNGVLSALRNIDQFIHGLAQKAKIKWSIEGDENSNFFHGILNKKRNQMNIRGITIDGVWKEQPNDVKQEFLSHFQDRFAKPSERRANIDMRFPKTISEDQSQDLEREVSKQEIKTAVWGCGTGRNPRPYGFSFGFYRHFWPVIEHDVYMAVNHFFIHGEIPPGCNSSFIALIPKVPDANLGVMLNEVQSAFIAERQMLDGPFILNEILQWCTKKKKKTLIFKVDFEKAFDSIRWDFLDDVLKGVGFRIYSVFHMSIFKVPSKVLHILESIRSHFFNGHDPGSKKASWVKWNNVLTDKKRGGLGVSSLFALNRGLMIKWVWKFLSQKDSLWTKVIVAIHGVGGKNSSEWDFYGKSCGFAFCLVELVRSVTIVPSADRWNWNLESTGIFSVASARRRIDEICLPNIGEETRWVKYLRFMLIENIAMVTCEMIYSLTKHPYLEQNGIICRMEVFACFNSYGFQTQKDVRRSLVLHLVVRLDLSKQAPI
ncbi:hypothetical protein Tco_1105481 [Tanacetum coccineum]